MKISKYSTCLSILLLMHTKISLLYVLIPQKPKRIYCLYFFTYYKSNGIITRFYYQLWIWIWVYWVLHLVTFIANVNLILFRDLTLSLFYLCNCLLFVVWQITFFVFSYFALFVLNEFITNFVLCYVTLYYIARKSFISFVFHHWVYLR